MSMAMTCFAWIVVFGIFIASLIHENSAPTQARSPFSDAHHFWYASTLYWAWAYLVTGGMLRTPVLIFFLLVMLDDGIEHFTGFSLVRNIYGRLGGTI